MDVSYITSLITKERPFGVLVVELLEKPVVSVVVMPEFFMSAFINLDTIATLTEYQQQYVASYLWQYYLRNKIVAARGKSKSLCKLKSWPASMCANATLEPILPLLVKPRMFIMAASNIAKTGVKWYHGSAGQTYLRCMRHVITLRQLGTDEKSMTGKLLSYILRLELEGCDTSYITDDLVGLLAF